MMQTEDGEDQVKSSAETSQRTAGRCTVILLGPWSNVI